MLHRMFLVFHQSQTWRTEHNAHLEPNTPHPSPTPHPQAQAQPQASKSSTKVTPYPSPRPSATAQAPKPKPKPGPFPSTRRRSSLVPGDGLQAPLVLRAALRREGGREARLKTFSVATVGEVEVRARVLAFLDTFPAQGARASAGETAAAEAAEAAEARSRGGRGGRSRRRPARGRPTRPTRPRMLPRRWPRASRAPSASPGGGYFA